MTTILCIETSTDICSVCVARDRKVFSIRETARSYSHSEVITVLIEECLDEAGIVMKDLDAVAVTSGPGSYTALRIGSSTAKGICYAMDIPLISVDTLKSLAYGIRDKVGEEDIIIPMLDARRKEVYHAIYDHSMNEMVAVIPIILDEETFLEYGNHKKIHFCGDGVPKSKDILKVENGVFHNLEASSRHLISQAFESFEHGKVEDTAYYTPFYFKSPNITVQKKNILF